MPTSDAQLVATLDRVMAGHGAADVPAAVAVIARPGSDPVCRARPTEADREPRFFVYSVTKTFTAALFLLLQEEGLLGLDDALARWVPRVPRSERITLRMLLNHTAGIPDYGGLAAYHQAVRGSPGRSWTFERYAAETYEKGLLFEPGQGWAYSNPGYMLLRRVAELVTGAPFDRLVDERIAEPLRLSRTGVALTTDDLAGLAPARSAALAGDGTPVDVRGSYDPGWVSHGVVASTASEVARFVDSLFSGRLIAEASLAEMTRLVPVPLPGSEAAPDERPYAWREPSYGLGLMADPASPWGPVYGHDGRGPGYAASVFHAPRLGGVTVCVLGAEAPGFAAEHVVFTVLDELARA